MTGVGLMKSSFFTSLMFAALLLSSIAYAGADGGDPNLGRQTAAGRQKLKQQQQGSYCPYQASGNLGDYKGHQTQGSTDFTRSRSGAVIN